jgi:hypothetical protein
MLDKLTIDSFAPHVGTSFWLEAGGRRIELPLTQASKVMESEAARLAHDSFPAPLDVFLVPVAGDASGYTHEAVFYLRRRPAEAGARALRAAGPGS